MRGLWRDLLAVVTVLCPLVSAADTPPIAPAYIAADLLAIGHVTGTRPPPGSGEGLGGCTATLIAPTLVLTAAHCAAHRQDAPENLFITFGWRNNGPPLWRGTAARVLVDPDYIAGRYEIETPHHDLALIILPRPVPEDPIEPIPARPGRRPNTMPATAI